MNKDQIRDIIFYKQNNNEILTEEEAQAATLYFSEEELECMRMPTFDHKSCFCGKPVSFLSESYINSLLNS